MFKLVLVFKGKSSLTVAYRGKGSVRLHAQRQRAIYKADSVAVFDENDTLVFAVLPAQKTRKRAT